MLYTLGFQHGCAIIILWQLAELEGEGFQGKSQSVAKWAG